MGTGEMKQDFLEETLQNNQNSTETSVENLQESIDEQKMVEGTEKENDGSIDNVNNEYNVFNKRIIEEKTKENEEIYHGEETDDHIKSPKKKNRLTSFQKKKRRKKIVSNIVSVIAWLIGFCLFVVCCSNLYQHFFNADKYTGFFGIGGAVVVSNSMEPEINVNDLVFYQEIDGSEIEKGDIVVYKKTSDNNDTMLIIHEVIQVEDGYITTKGINNAVPDESIPTSEVVGKYVYKIGGLGSLLGLFSTIWAPMLIAILFTVILIFRIVIYVIHRKHVIRSISSNEETRDAIEYFFDI